MAREPRAARRRPTGMLRMLLLAPVLLLLAACGADGEARAEDPVISDPPPRPTVVPAAPGDVVTRGLVTVIDAGDGPVACLGAVAESWPPQCTGPAVAGWDWSQHGRHAERSHGVRWGDYSLRGTWDGTTLTLAEAVPAALHDPRPGGDPEPPGPASGDRSPADLEELAEELGETLPGAQGAFVDESGHVLVSVSYDDGSLQEWVDDVYGSGVVVVTGQLVDA